MVVFDEYLSENMSTNQMIATMMGKGYSEEKACEYVISSLLTGAKISFNMMSATGNASVYASFKDFLSRAYIMCKRYMLIDQLNLDKTKTPAASKVQDVINNIEKLLDANDLEFEQDFNAAIDNIFGNFATENYVLFTSSKNASKLYSICDTFAENQENEKH